MVGTSDPAVPCREGNVYQNTATVHDWICNSSGTWVDQGGVSAYGSNLQKNIWETKVSRGVRLYGNVFEDAWYPLTWNVSNFIVVNQTSQYGAEPWATVADLRIWGNKFTKGNAILAVGYPSQLPCTANRTTDCLYYGANNIRMWDNLGYGLADAKDYWVDKAGTGGFAQWAVGTFDMEYRNNTFLTSTTAGSGVTYGIGNAWRTEARGDMTNLQKIWGQNIVRDNIAPVGGGLKGEMGGSDGGTWMGECTLVLGMLPGVGGYDARGNLWTNDLGWYWSEAGRAGTKSPLNCGWTMFDPNTDFGQWWQSSTMVQSRGTGTVVDAGTYKVKEAYRNSGSDGRDPGANIDLVNWATAGAATGEVNSFLDMKIRSIRASSNAATLNVTAPSLNACAVELSQSNRFDTLRGAVEYSQTGKDVRANVSGLTPGTYYFVRVLCDGYQLESTLLTSP
jgi:hypothetical protein